MRGILQDKFGRQGAVESRYQGAFLCVSSPCGSTDLILGVKSFSLSLGSPEFLAFTLWRA